MENIISRHIEDIMKDYAESEGISVDEVKKQFAEISKEFEKWKKK